MNTNIHISGKLTSDEVLTSAIKRKIQAIRNDYGNKAFTIWDGAISFAEADHYGFNPFDAAIENPIKDLIQCAEDNKIKLSGKFYLTNEGERGEKVDKMVIEIVKNHVHHLPFDVKASDLSDSYEDERE